MEEADDFLKVKYLELKWAEDNNLATLQRVLRECIERHKEYIKAQKAKEITDFKQLTLF